VDISQYSQPTLLFSALFLDLLLTTHLLVACGSLQGRVEFFGRHW